MRLRPVRPNIYLPVVRFGVADSDWKYVLAITCLGYMIPFFTGIRVLAVPLELWGVLLSAAGSVAFFNYVRVGRRPFWLQHKLQALVKHHRHHRTIPNRKKAYRSRAWVTTAPNKGKDSAQSHLGGSYVARVIEANNQV